MDFHKIFLFFYRVLNGVYTPIRINYQARVLMGSVASVDIQRKVTKYHNLPMNHSYKNVHRESSKQLRNILLQDVFHIFFFSIYKCWVDKNQHSFYLFTRNVNVLSNVTYHIFTYTSKGTICEYVYSSLNAKNVALL